MKKAIFLVVGCLALGLGAVGALMPVLPSVPFLMLAAFCFARSSRKLNDWFTHTKLYRNNLESYVDGKGMTRSTKIRIMILVTALMAVGFAMMGSVAVGRVVLVCVWLAHVAYFCFGIKTIPATAV